MTFRTAVLPPGSPEDVARVDRADLMQARDRFLNSNNATLAIIGGVTKAARHENVCDSYSDHGVKANRSCRQLFASQIHLTHEH